MVDDQDESWAGVALDGVQRDGGVEQRHGGGRPAVLASAAAPYHVAKVLKIWCK